MAAMAKVKEHSSFANVDEARVTHSDYGTTLAMLLLDWSHTCIATDAQASHNCTDLMSSG